MVVPIFEFHYAICVGKTAVIAHIWTGIKPPTVERIIRRGRGFFVRVNERLVYRRFSFGTVNKHLQKHTGMNVVYIASIDVTAYQSRPVVCCGKGPGR